MMLPAKSAIGFEKNFGLLGVRTAFSSDVKPNDNGPVDLFFGRPLFDCRS